VSTSTVRILRAAADIVGGAKPLAERLVIDEHLLAKYMSDLRELPDALLLRVVDIILADRQARRPPGTQLVERGWRGSSRR
jgi:hypothetical protein